MSDSNEKITAPRPTGAGLMGGGGRGGMRGAVEKPKDFWGTARRLLGYLRPQRVKLILVVILAVSSTAFAVWAPKISGNAVNELMNGFVAKSMVSEISKAQEQYLPEVKDMLQQLQSAQDAAVKAAQEEVAKQFSATLAKQKQDAYAQAEAAARKAIVSNPPKELTAAVQQAQAEVKKQFDAKVAAQKQAAYAQAETAAKQAIASNPPAELTAAIQQAQEAAKAAAKQQVDAQFAAQAPGVPLENIPGYATALAAAQGQAADAAKAQVLSAAEQQAVAQAHAAVDAQFAARTADMDKALADAQAQAADAAKSAVEKAFLDKAKLTADQFAAMKQLVDLPVVNTITDYNKKADTIQAVIDLGKNLPLTTGQSSQAQSFDVSQTDLDKGLDIVRKNGGHVPLDAIGRILLGLLAIYLASALLRFLTQFIMSTVVQTTAYNMRTELDNKLARVPLSYYDSHSNGEILSRMTNDMDTVSQTLQQSITQIITAMTELVGYVYMMLTISGKLTLIAVASLPLYLLATTFIMRRSQKYYVAQQTHLGRLTSHAEEMYSGHKIVKAFGHEQEAVDTFENVNDQLYQAGWRAQFMSGIMMPLMNFISNIAYVFIAVIGGIFVTNNLLNLGDITAFIQYSRSFSMPIVQTASIANVFQSTMAAAERVFSVLDEPEEQPDPADAVTIANPRGDIALDHVDFSYRPDEPLIKDFNLDVKRGDTVAIVGPTGAGKTTLVNLLMRFYEIQGGSITFDGVDTRRMRRGDLRTMFGMVLQDTWLFNGTVRENIAYARDDATDEEVVAAAKAAHADHFIRSLPQGYDTVLDEDASNISAGQKQLLTIARVVLANPSVLILDEATSSVDTRTEVRIQKAMAQLMEGRTSFVIAHRLSTIRDAHHILVMNHGTIVEQGTHKELLAKGGFYADLYNSQFVGAAVTDDAV
ncbi:MAG TPA: ABC transporter ATP-binding protein [Candidatus Cryosericum sp.]|nr:ABC transporter ATP-binding protein [Candidatus Cryosericum sp.]